MGVKDQAPGWSDRAAAANSRARDTTPAATPRARIQGPLRSCIACTATANREESCFSIWASVACEHRLLLSRLCIAAGCGALHTTTMEYSRTSSTPPATARPKNPPPPSSMSSAHAASGSQQAPAMAASRTARGSTPTASRSAAKLVDADKPARPASRDSLKQKMLKKPDDAHRPCKSEEVRAPADVHNGTEERASPLTLHSNSKPSSPTSTPSAHTSPAKSVTACSTSHTQSPAATHTAIP